ncbi:MAG: AsmA family protein [Nitrospirae bacterium]|nr:AsmA family protein [Nitrospirota bacterium]
MLKKISIYISAFMLIAIIGIAVFIKTFITPERIKSYIISTAENALSRKVGMGEISLSFFKGIEAKDFAIKEADESTDFLKCREFVLKYQFMPLFSKKLVIDELVLSSPEVRIERDRSGAYNFETIGKKKGIDETAQKLDESEASLISLLINRIEVNGLKFTLTDLKKELPGMKGAIDLDASIKSSGTELISDGLLKLRLDELSLKKTVKDISVSIDYGLSLNTADEKIGVNKAEITAQNIPLSLKGIITGYKTEANADIGISLPKVNAPLIQELISKFIEMKEMKITGELAADLKVSGPLKKSREIMTEGVVNLSNISITSKDITATLDGKIKFGKELLGIDLNASTGRNSARLKGSVKDYLGKRDIALDIYSKELFLDELMPAAPEKRPSAAMAGGSESTEEAKPLALNDSAKGEVRIDSAVYKNIKMHNFFLKYGFKDNRLDIEKMTAAAGTGTISIQGRVDMSKPGYAYAFTSEIDSIHADELVNTFFPKAKDTVFGNISAGLKMSGAGTLPENIKKNLEAEGNFIIRNGRIMNNMLSDRFALFLGVERLKTISLNRGEGSVRIRNGIANLNSIFSSDDISLGPAGTIGLNETLGLAFDLSLSPALTSQVTRNSSIASYIRDDAGWGQIPLKISGTFSNPSYSVDLAKAGKRVIKKKAIEIIDDVLNKNKSDSQDNDSGRQDIQKPIEDLLKGIFK